MPWLIHHLLTFVGVLLSQRATVCRLLVVRGGGSFRSCDCDAVLTPVAVLASPAPALVASAGSTIVVELSEDPEGQLYALLRGLRGQGL